MLEIAAAQRAKAVELRPLYTSDEGWLKPKISYTYDFNLYDAAQYARYYGVDSVFVKPVSYYHP